MNEIIDADAAWPETQTNDGNSDCDEIVVAGEGEPLQEDERGQDDHDLEEFGGAE